MGAKSEVSWSLDREIVLSRVFDAPRALVFDAWMRIEHLREWFGPRGFKTVTKEADIRQGGVWRFDMIAPDGTVFDNRMEFVEVKAPELLVMNHGSDKDEDPHRFRVTVTFDEQADKKTIVTMRQLHPSKEQRAATIGFGAVELGYQTLDKLAEHLRRMS